MTLSIKDELILKYILENDEMVRKMQKYRNNNSKFFAKAKSCVLTAMKWCGADKTQINTSKIMLTLYHKIVKEES